MALIDAPDRVIDALHRRGCIDQAQRRDIASLGWWQKKKKILNIISDRSSSDVERFIACMEETGQHHVLFILKNNAGKATVVVFLIVSSTFELAKQKRHSAGYVTVLCFGVQLKVTDYQEHYLLTNENTGSTWFVIPQPGAHCALHSIMRPFHVSLQPATCIKQSQLFAFQLFHR